MCKKLDTKQEQTARYTHQQWGGKKIPFEGFEDFSRPERVLVSPRANLSKTLCLRSRKVSFRGRPQVPSVAETDNHYTIYFKHVHGHSANLFSFESKNSFWR